MKVLLTGRTRAVIDEVVAALRDLDVRFFAANTVEEVDGVLGRADLDHVILGGGLDLDSRLLIVRRVCEASDSTTVHMNSQSGPETDLPSSDRCSTGSSAADGARPRAVIVALRDG